jgi:uncharacterized surface protein with fasciclin (FAS1) repeats
MISKLFAAAMLAVASAQDTIVNTVIANNDTLSTLLGILVDPVYVEVLDALNSATPEAPFTVFAPLDSANWDVLGSVEENKATLYYHVITSGSFPAGALAAKQFVNTASIAGALLDGKGAALGIVKAGDVVTLSNGVATFTATVVTPDIVCTNGVVHTIDTVLQIPKTVSATATLAQLNELVDALTKAMLVNLVDTTESVTIFAPNDQAMLDANWKDLTVAQLTEVLAYHVIVGTVAYSTMIVDGTVAGPVTTYGGQDVTVALEGGSVKINDATVTIPDALVTNGVVHVIDKVLIPVFAVVTGSPTSATVSSETGSPTTATVISETGSPTSASAPSGNSTDAPTTASSDTGAPTTVSSATASSMAFACLFSVVAAVALN